MTQNIPDKSLFFLNPEIVFLNHGSFGATPRPVFESYQRWQLELERQPVEFLGRRAAGLLRESREALAAWLKTSPENLVYITNTTIGLNIVARSLALGPGDIVVTTDHEYGAMDRTWRFLSKKYGFLYQKQEICVPVRETNEVVEQLWKGVTSQTKVIFISHVTSPTALIFPVKEICRRARHAGILTVIDGAHAPGQIPLNLEELGADFYAGNLHKWLCAPKGSAFLYARPGVQHLLEPLVVSWGYEPEIPGPSPFIDLLEWSGTRDLASFLAVPDAIRFQQVHDWEAVRSRSHDLATRAGQEIGDLLNIQPLTPLPSSWYAQMISVPLPQSVDVLPLKEWLYEKHRIEVPLFLWNGSPLMRISFQAYNTAEDLDVLLLALRKYGLTKEDPA